MIVLHLILLAFALVLEAIGASTLVSGENRARVIAAGLAFLTASFINW